MEKKTDFLKEDRIGKFKKDSLYLDNLRQDALNQSVLALKKVIDLQKISHELSVPNQGNALIAKKDIVDAIVNLAICAAEGDYDRTTKVLSEYGLEDLI